MTTSSDMRGFIDEDTYRSDYESNLNYFGMIFDRACTLIAWYIVLGN